jgi:hypothetical protein
MSSRSASDPHRRLSWPLHAALVPALYAWLAWSWWREIHAQLVTASVAAPMPEPVAMAGVALGARLLATLTESACYVLWWRGRGLTLSFWRFTAWVAALSSADLFGAALRRAAIEGPAALRWLAAALAGPIALEPTPVVESGLAAAFGTFGVLTVLRITGTAWAQARGIGRSPAAPLAVTGVAWSVTRLGAWWSFDLLRGMSPVR